jgi:hypothetical protein
MRWILSCLAVCGLLCLTWNSADAGCHRKAKCRPVSACTTSCQSVSVVTQTRVLAVTTQRFAYAPQTSAEQWADELHRRGRLDHDVAYISRGGAEVLAVAPDQATAWRIWQHSPPHAALLRHITRVTCRNGVCIGRSG